MAAAAVTPGPEAADLRLTAAQAAIFGGTAGIMMHPCYHAPCDRLDTTNVKFLDDLSDAGAHATLWFAMDGQ